MQRLELHDGSWQMLIYSWQDHAFSMGQELDLDNHSSLNMLKKICREDKDDPFSGVFSLADAEGLCLAHAVKLKNYNGKVLRVRHINLHPKHDFAEESSTDAYATALTKLFADVIILAKDMDCAHFKIHFQSPADTVLFKAMVNNNTHHADNMVLDMKGAWLYGSIK